MSQPLGIVPGTPRAAAEPIPVPRMVIDRFSKRFGRTQVLDRVSLSIEAGEIHGLAGQNGSGKSTLVKLLTGLYSPDPGGSYLVDGRPMRLPVRWSDVHRSGVSVVHQDMGLLDHLSVAENICAGGFPTTRWTRRIDGSARDLLATRTLRRLGVTLDPGRKVATLSATERAEVAIARALRDHNLGGGLLILDEATRALAGNDLDRLHSLLCRVADDGGSVLVISHDLPELMSLTDKITVLRDGTVVGAGLSTAEHRQQDIATLMLGNVLPTLNSAAAARATSGLRPHWPAKVTVSALTGRRVADLNFEVGVGEIVGITGANGSGHDEIPYLLGGAVGARSGSVTTPRGTVSLKTATPARCLAAGVALVPERRDRDGLAFDLGVRDNICLPAFRTHSRPWRLRRAWQRSRAADVITRLDIRPPLDSIVLKHLSGGNQQKVMVGKWLATEPALLVLHEPTQAVDVGARHDILLSLREAAQLGAAVLVVSCEPDDLAAVCDRVLVHRGPSDLQEAALVTAEALICEIHPALSTSGVPQ